MEAWRGFYYLSLFSVEITKRILMLILFKIHWCIVLFHMWVLIFNPYAPRGFKMLTWIFLYMLLLECKLVEITNTRQIENMLMFDNINETWSDLRFWIIVDLEKGWVIEIHLISIGVVAIKICINYK